MSEYKKVTRYCSKFPEGLKWMMILLLLKNINLIKQGVALYGVPLTGSSFVHDSLD